jgi:hypothetical protein
MLTDAIRLLLFPALMVMALIARRALTPQGATP